MCIICVLIHADPTAILLAYGLGFAITTKATSINMPMAHTQAVTPATPTITIMNITITLHTNHTVTRHIRVQATKT